MPTVGILCEKLSAMNNFSKALGGPQGTFNGVQYRIVAARGHLYELVSPHLQVSNDLSAKYQSWNISNLPWNPNDFKWTKAPKKNTDDILEKIKRVLSACDEIAIATDNDPSGEGELLAWEILYNLKLQPKMFTRIYFDDESAPSIIKGFQTRKPISSMLSDGEYLKADYRSKFDFLTMQFTRIATAYGCNRNDVLRQGRLKSAMVVLVGDAERAIANYKRIPFYQNRFKDNNGNIFVNPKEPMYPNEQDVPLLYRPTQVVLDSSVMKSQSPPKLLDLMSLSSILATKGIKPKAVLQTYQMMYEQQIVSYPRTQDKTITIEQLHQLLPIADQIADVVGVDKSLLTHRNPRPTHIAGLDGKKVDCSHGANRPGSNVPQSLAQLDQYGFCARAIYILLAKNFLAMLAEDYKYEQQSAHLADYADFKCVLNIPKDLGYKKIFNDDDDIDTNADIKSFGTIAQPFIYKGYPPKPPTPTIKWLKRQLETHDVGTGATRTSILADVTNEGKFKPLINEDKGRLSLSDSGKISYALLPNTHIGSIDMTETMYADMQAIEKGKTNAAVCLAKIQNWVLEDIATMQRNSAVLHNGFKFNQTAAANNNNNDNNNNNNNEYCRGVWKPFGQEVQFKRLWNGHRFTDEEVQRLFNGETIKVTGLISKKTGKPYSTMGKLSKLQYNGRTYIGFESQSFASGVPDSWCNHTFTENEKEQLRQGNAVYCDDFVSKKGSIFQCNVIYGKNEKGVMAIIPQFDND